MPKRNSTADDTLEKFERVYNMLVWMSAPGGCSSRTIAGRTGVAVRTVQRDIDRLKHKMCFDIRSDRGVHRLNPDQLKVGPTLSLDEVLCLALGTIMLGKQMSSVSPEAMRKLLHFIKGDRRTAARELPESVAVGPSADRSQWLPQITRAVSERRCLRFTYERGEAGTRVLSPYTVFYQDERWYVWGIDHRSEELRRFRLHRMITLEVLERTFVRPASYPNEAALFHKWDVSSAPPVRVLCRVSPELAAWLAENPVHPSQQLDGDAFSLQVRNLEALSRWMLGLTGLEVLEPMEFRRLVRSKAESVASIYRDDIH